MKETVEVQSWSEKMNISGRLEELGWVVRAAEGGLYLLRKK